MRVIDEAKTTVVILGGSFGGLAVAKALHRSDASGVLDVIVIEKRGYCDINFASPRLLQNPDLASNIIKEYSEFKWLSGGNVKFVQATVSELHADRVTTTSGETFKFNYCVVATGESLRCVLVVLCGARNLLQSRRCVLCTEASGYLIALIQHT